MFVPQNRFQKFLPRMGKKMLFIHTPKCGGSYINSAFGRAHKRCISIKHKALKGHLTWREYKSKMAEIGLLIDDFATFSVIS